MKRPNVLLLCQYVAYLSQSLLLIMIIIYSTHGKIATQKHIKRIILQHMWPGLQGHSVTLTITQYSLSYIKKIKSNQIKIIHGNTVKTAWNQFINLPVIILT